MNATAFRLLATETAWGGHNEAMKAQSMVNAYTKLWNPDPVVAGVVPFLLAGQHWDSYGFTWVGFSGRRVSALQPIYRAIQSLATNAN